MSTKYWSGAVRFGFDVDDGTTTTASTASLTVEAIARDWETSVTPEKPESEVADKGELESELIEVAAKETLNESDVDSEEKLIEPELNIQLGSSLEPAPMDGNELVNVMANMGPDLIMNKYVERAHLQMPPKTIDLHHLDITPFELASPEPLEVRSVMENSSFIKELDMMNQDLDEAMEDSEHRYRLGAETMVGISMSLSAGIVSWVLRSGSLMASFMSVLPLWKQLDPLPILGAASMKKKKEQAEQQEVEGKPKEQGIEDIFGK